MAAQEQLHRGARRRRVVATVLGTLAAVGLNKANFRGKGLLMAMLISPMIVPVVVVGVGMYLFFAPLGLPE